MQLDEHMSFYRVLIYVLYIHVPGISSLCSYSGGVGLKANGAKSLTQKMKKKPTALAYRRLHYSITNSQMPQNVHPDTYSTVPDKALVLVMQLRFTYVEKLVETVLIYIRMGFSQTQV